MTYDEAVALVSEPIVPAETKTYMPVPNENLFKLITNITSEYLGKEPESFGAKLNKTGDQMFGSINYANGAEDTQMQIGFRNSYNKTLPVGLIAGASVIVCGNGMFVGDIMTVRKHTSNVWNDINDIIQTFCDIIEPSYKETQWKKDKMKMNVVGDQTGAHLLGEMFVIEEILTTPMLNIAKKEWLEPQHDSFKGRNAWSLFNACTEAMKHSHPSEAMERHQSLDKFFVDEFDLKNDEHLVNA